MNIQGLIHKIERFSLHDGPGIRTLVIMKGCPLRCRWCSSPHTQDPNPEILYIRSKCKGCGLCIEVCPQKAILRGADPFQVKTDRAICISCGECIVTCPNQARELSGQHYTAEELFREVEKDAAFYRRSGGGITLGGGEPTMQAEFIGEFLALCRSHFFHTAMETSALTSWEKLKPILLLLDLIYVDLKHMDQNKHREWTGAANDLILENIKRTAQVCKLIVRVPIIPEFNDSNESISEIARFVKNLDNRFLRLELLPYHQFGIHHYNELERAYPIESIQPPSDERMTELRDIARALGITVEIGG
ncbi:MAG: glycyl-radical enzyme activating protein [Promethearchaeota archaeon]